MHYVVGLCRQSGGTLGFPPRLLSHGFLALCDSVEQNFSPGVTERATEEEEENTRALSRSAVKSAAQGRRTRRERFTHELVLVKKMTVSET